MITVFIDSQAAIIKILNLKARVGWDAIWNLIYQNVYVIKNGGHIVVLKWVFSHSKILENRNVDTTTKHFAHKKKKEINHWNLLTVNDST